MGNVFHNPIGLFTERRIIKMKKDKSFRIVPASEQVASILRTEILARKLKPGDVINLNEVAQNLGVSNTPVREALQILKQDDLVQLRPNRGAIVIGVDRKRIQDYYQVRVILENTAAGIASEKEDVSTVAEAFDNADRCVKEGRWEEYSNYNQAFHAAIWELTDNPKMIGMMSSLWNSSSKSVFTDEKNYVSISHEEHRIIKDAILAHDAIKASSVMKAHLIRSMNDILTHFDEE